MHWKDEACLVGTHFPELGTLVRGKVRDCYVAGDRRYLIASDRVSAFDVVYAEPVPFKGRVLNEMTRFFTELAQEIVPCAYERSPHPNVIVARECPVYPVEMVVRGYLAGSAWRAYAAGDRQISGVPVPDGLGKHARLPQPIVTPSTKADEGHDEPISREEIIAQGLVPEAIYAQMERMALALFAQGSEHAADRGLILVDTKYEFGHDASSGEAVLVDEVHTADSSRYFWQRSWERDPENPEQLSKEFLRDWLRETHDYMGEAGRPVPALDHEVLSELSQRYIDLCTTLTGQAPQLDGEVDLHAEIYTALQDSGDLTGRVAIVVADEADAAQKIQSQLSAAGVPSSALVVDAAQLESQLRWAEATPGELVFVDARKSAGGLAAQTSRPVFPSDAEPEAVAQHFAAHEASHA